MPEESEYNKCLYAIAHIKEKIEQLEARLQKCEDSYNILQEQINANNKALEKECEDMLNRPTVLVSKLAELGFKGTWTREDPIYNSNISDKPIGSYTETINTDNSEKKKYYWFRGNKKQGEELLTQLVRAYGAEPNDILTGCNEYSLYYIDEENHIKFCRLNDPMAKVLKEQGINIEF